VLGVVLPQVDPHPVEEVVSVEEELVGPAIARPEAVARPQAVR